MSALVSIVIPAYQSARWVRDAVASALAQTHPSCEVIVVDDGSTDGTAALLAAAFADAIQIVQQPNRGLAAARNTGLRRARGEYVQFLDADDVLLPDKIATQVAAFGRAPDVDVAFCDFAWLVEGRTQLADMPVPEIVDGHALHALLGRNFIVCHAALVRTAALQRAGGFDETLSACEDYDLWLRLAGAGSRFLHTPGKLALYRRTPGSMSAQSERQFSATADVLAKAERGGLARSRSAARRLRRHRAGVQSMIARLRARDALRHALRGELRTAAARAAAAASAAAGTLRVLAVRGASTE